MNKTLPMIILGVLVLAGLGFAARGMFNKATDAVSDTVAENVAESIINNANGNKANVDISNGTVNVTTTDGNASYGVGAKLHSTFPNSVPTPSNASVVTSYAGQENGKTTHAAIFTSYQSVSAVSNAYKAQLEQAGFNVQVSGSSNVNGAETTGYTANKGNLTVNVAITGNGSASTITLAVVEE